MARLEFTGTEQTLEELYRESERLERKATEMLGEAGAIVVKAWQDAIQAAGHAEPGKSGRATGDLYRSVRASKPKKDGEAYTSTIYPNGRDRHGQSLAEIAFVLHYGTSSRKGDHFVDDAEARAADAAEKAMQEVWERD